MADTAAIQATAAQVLWAAFALAIAFGAIAQATHFCTMGAVSDVVTMGDWTRMRMWVLAMGVAIVGFNAMVGLGWLEAGKSIYGGSRWLWLSALVGGGLFGFGMVLASGCGSKSLVRVGGGNLKSLVVVLVLGISSWATLKGITAVLRVATVDQVALELPAGQDLPSLLAQVSGAGAGSLAWAVGVLVGGACIVWALAARAARSPYNLVGGVGIGLVIVACWWVSGRLGFVAEDPNTLEEVFLATNSRRMEALSFVAPIAYTIDWLVFFSDRSKLLTMGIVATFGVVVGSAVAALANGSFRWEGFRDVADTARHLLGGVLMGIGGVTAMGCTIGQGLSGLSTLGLTSFTALGAIIAGAVAALKYEEWRVLRDA